MSSMMHGHSLRVKVSRFQHLKCFKHFRTLLDTLNFLLKINSELKRDQHSFLLLKHFSLSTLLFLLISLNLSKYSLIYYQNCKISCSLTFSSRFFTFRIYVSRLYVSPCPCLCSCQCPCNLDVN